MSPEHEILVIKADYGTTTKHIVVNLILLALFFGVTLYCIVRFLNLYDFKIEADTLRITILFLCSAPLFILSLSGLSQISQALTTRKELPILYTLCEGGYTDHRSKIKYIWEDFFKIYNYSNDYKGGRRCIILDVKHTRGIAKLETKYITRQDYRLMALHVKKFAPKVLTTDIKIPVITITT